MREARRLSLDELEALARAHGRREGRTMLTLLKLLADTTARAQGDTKSADALKSFAETLHRQAQDYGHDTKHG